MDDIRPFLKELISEPGLSGYEAPVRRKIAEVWSGLADVIEISKIGSLHALKRGTAAEKRPAVLIAAHMDAIGLMVTRVQEEFLYITEIGGLDARVLPGQLVIVHGSEELPGVIVQPPGWLLPKKARSGPVDLPYLLVDTGLPAGVLSKRVRPGDLVSFAQPPLEMGEQYLAGHSLDNRASVAALTDCLQRLQRAEHAWDVWAVATVLEEETLGGAATSTFQVRPDLAIAVDVCFGKSPGSPAHKTFELGKGPVLGWGPNVHSGLHRAIKDAADRIELETQFEPLPRGSGTDAVAMQVAAEGIPTMVVSIPLRYMHTPVEVIHMKDIVRTGRLLAEFIRGLQADFLDKLSLDG